MHWKCLQGFTGTLQGKLEIDLLLRKSRNVILLFTIKKYELLNLAVLLKSGHLWDKRTTVLKSRHLREIRIHSIK